MTDKCTERPSLRTSQSSKDTRGAIFLDRDGDICVNRSDHVKSWDAFQFLSEAKKSLAALNRLGWPIIVVTNQAIINRSIVSADTLDDIHQRMLAEVAAAGERIDKVIYCPHHPDENCECRKPEPGMLWQAARNLEIDLSNSYLIGDALTDIMAGTQVGCRDFLVLTGRGSLQLKSAHQLGIVNFTVARNLMDATVQILEAEQKNNDDSQPLRQITGVTGHCNQLSLFKNLTNIYV